MLTVRKRQLSWCTCFPETKSKIINFKYETYCTNMSRPEYCDPAFRAKYFFLKLKRGGGGVSVP